MRSLLLALVFALAVVTGCQKFDPPPSPTVVGLEGGEMTTQTDAPFVIRFSEPIRGGTLKVKLAKYIQDAEGNLLDEQSPPDPEAFKESIVAAYDGSATEDEDRTYGATFDETDNSISIVLDSAFEVSQSYVAIIEPGLEDLDGHATVPRIRIPFSFKLEGGCPTAMQTGYYYFILNVDYLATQIQVFTYLEMNQDTGEWRGIFTNANRLADLNSRPGCPSCSGDTNICALVPSPTCVKPSEKQLSLDQYVDFLPEKEPPYGYYFITDGFACDQPNGTTAFGTPPFLIEVTVGTGSILVDAQNSIVSGVFRKHDDGRWRATGGLSTKCVKLNKQGVCSPSGGNWAAMSLTDDEVKAVESYGYPIPTDLAR
jgi:hypothetical protein